MSLNKFKLPMYLVLILLISMLFGHLFPSSFKSLVYSFSLSIKEVLTFILPLMIFTFIFHSIVKMQGNSLLFVIILLPLVCLSNFSSTWLAYLLSKPLLSFSALNLSTAFQEESLNVLWSFSLPKIISNDSALFLGLFLGVIAPYISRTSATKLSERLYKLNNRILKIFAKVIPLFILGFVLKLEHEGVLSHILKSYSAIFAIAVGLVYGYIILLYLLLNQFVFRRMGAALRNMAPAVICGFSTMSSAASMPFTILGSKQNLKKPEVAEAVIPSTVNIHLIGDCFAIPIFALAIMTSYGIALPEPSVYLIFALYFILAKFAVAAVPGGGILVMLPIIEQHLGFSPDMLSLITALYIIFDPIITSANVAGNGAFAMFFEKTMNYLSSVFKKSFKYLPIKRKLI